MNGLMLKLLLLLLLWRRQWLLLLLELRDRPAHHHHFIHILLLWLRLVHVTDKTRTAHLLRLLCLVLESCAGTHLLSILNRIIRRIRDNCKVSRRGRYGTRCVQRGELE